MHYVFWFMLHNITYCYFLNEYIEFACCVAQWKIHESSKWQGQNYNLSFTTPEPVYLSFKQIFI